MHFICPLCQTPLVKNTSGVTCSHGHHFDRAKEGYLNLLPVHYKNSSTPGDARSQLQSRRVFLNAGFFSGLLPALTALLPDHTKSLLDIGCGEGYFTQGLAAALPTGASVYGIDIARDGIKMAAKSYSQQYAVASAFSLPLAFGSMDVVSRIYAPSEPGELKRVLATNGRVIVVTPAQDHLLALRQKIYTTIRPHPEPGLLEGFRAIHQQRLSLPLDIPAGALTEALIRMTPFAWRMGLELQQQLIESGLQDTADFHITLYTLDA